MKNMDEDLAKKIIDENILVHSKEAKIYDIIHAEIFNKYEQKRTKRDIDFIAKHISTKKPSVLDIGCGTGNLSLKFLNLGFLVSGVDISKNMLDILRNKTKSRSLVLIESDVDSFIHGCKEEKYDVITFSSVLHHLPDYLVTIETAIKLLKENGIIYITHEPTRQIYQKSYTSLFWNVFTKIDSLAFCSILHLKRVKTPPIDYTWSDYHCKQGIDSKEISNYLRDNNFQILYYEEYNVRKFTIFSILDNIFNCSKHLFKITAKKTGGGK